MKKLLMAVGCVVVAGSGAMARPDGDHECQVMKSAGDAPPLIGFMDEKTGKDLLNYPVSPRVEYKHMALAIEIADMNVPRMDVVQRLKFAAVGYELGELELDAKLLEIKSVSLAGKSAKVEFKHEGEKLRVVFDPPLKVGDGAELVTTYAVNDPPAGIIWTPESKAWPGRPAQLHSQGQANSNSYWFPCHDYPNVRLTTEMTVTVPDGFVVSSNGKLVETKRENGRTRFHWLQDKPHVNYLVTLVVGKFDVENLTGGSSKVPMPVYAPVGRGGDIKRTFGNTPRMIDLFARVTGQPYPWDQYAQVVVWNFGPGGMENTSATTLYDTAILSAEGHADQDLDGLIAHELAHQYFGDYITCKSWEHIWLNEGFATYLANLWTEERDGKDEYLVEMLRDFDRLTPVDRADAPYQPAMVSKEGKGPGDAFGRAANPYPKGSSILHMLRKRLGDEVFFKGIAAYVQAFKLRTVETADFRRAMEGVSGESLEKFFDQWCYRPGMPVLRVACAWDAAASELEVRVEQRQTIDGYNPAYEFTLPVWITPRVGAVRVEPIEVTERTAVRRVKLEGEPLVVAVDPELSVLARMTVEQPLARWMAQLDRGPTLASRIQAARALGRESTSISAGLLSRRARDAKAPKALRVECVRALVARKETWELAELARAGLDSRDAREALAEGIPVVLAVEKLDKSARTALVGFLRTAAAKDESGRARAAALRAIGKAKLREEVGVLVAAAGAESQHDRVRQGAMDGLGDLDAAEGLPVVIRYAAPGTNSRTRPGAIAALAKLAHHNPDAARAALVPLLTDREARARNAARDGVASLPVSSELKSALEAARSSERVTAERERLTRLIDRGLPGAPAGPAWVSAADGLAWYPVRNLGSWATTEEEKNAMITSVAEFFAARGCVADKCSDGVYMLCWDEPGRRMTSAEGPWAIVGGDAGADEGGRKGLALRFDDAGSRLLGGLIERGTGKGMVVLVDDGVTSPHPASQSATSLVIAAPAGERETADLRHELVVNPSRLSVRSVVAPGELPNEAALRERMRKMERK